MRPDEVVFPRCAQRIGSPRLSWALALLLGATPLAGTAATIVVTTSGDTGTAATCTLRQAIVAMNTSSLTGTACVNSGAAGFHANDLITFNTATFPSGGTNTITLADASSATLTITDPNLTIDAVANGRVTIERPTGASSSYELIGHSVGGKLTLKQLTLVNAVFSAISATFANSELTVVGCMIEGSLGSGIRSVAKLTLIDTTITGGAGGSGGGGISAQGNVVALINSTIRGNSAARGGGILQQGGSLSLTNSTVSGNSASIEGGGIYAMALVVTLNNSTISANSAVDSGGGILSLSLAPNVVNSIIAGNVRGSTATVASDLQGASPSASSSGSFIGGNPGLGTLADNGGATWTMRPLPGSPVIDAIPCTNAPATDQRGTPRPQIASCDIGAVEATLGEATAPPTIAKVFGANTIPLEGTTTLTFTVANPNAVGSPGGVSLTNVSFTDSLPAGLVVATPSGLANTCGGIATAGAGTTSASLSGATLAAGSSCTVTLTVKGTTPGTKNNSVQVTSAGANGVGNTSVAVLTVTASPPQISHSFGASAIALNGTTSLALDVGNFNLLASLTNVAFTANLPAGLVVATPNALTSACGGTVTAVAGTGSVVLANGTIDRVVTCRIVVNVQGTTPGVKTSTVQASASVVGAGNTSVATLRVFALAPVIQKSFGATTIPHLGTTSLTITVNNPNATESLTGIDFRDDLPGGLVVATPNGASSTCDGALAALESDSAVILTGASLSGGASCTVTVSVRGITSGLKQNTVTVTSVEGGPGITAAATLTVIAPATISTQFGKSTLLPGETTTLTVGILNPNVAGTVGGDPLTDIGFTIGLPPGLVVHTPSGLSNTCGGTATAVAGSSFTGLFGAALAAGATCAMTFEVRGTTSGVKGIFFQVNSSGGASDFSSATLTVGPGTMIFGNGFEAFTGPTVTTLRSGLFGPSGIAVDASGNVFVAEVLGNRVSRLTAPAYTAMDVIGSAFANPYGVALDASGNLFVANYGNSTVLKLASPGYGTAVPLGSGLSRPGFIAVDANGDVYVADSGNQAVKKILAPDYTMVTPLGAPIQFPLGVAVDTAGNVYVSDSFNNAVKRILAPAYTTVETLGAGHEFSNPAGLAVDAGGNVFVADSNNNAVKEIRAPGYTTVNTIAAGFPRPVGIALGADGRLFVTVAGDNTVKMIIRAPN